MSVTIDITEIMRDMAAERKNQIGDYWSRSWCNNAADDIDRLRQEVKDLENQIDDIYMDQAGADA